MEQYVEAHFVLIGSFTSKRAPFLTGLLTPYDESLSTYRLQVFFTVLMTSLIILIALLFGYDYELHLTNRNQLIFEAHILVSRNKYIFGIFKKIYYIRHHYITNKFENF